MQRESVAETPQGRLLGEIESRIVGMQYCVAAVAAGEQVNLEREPQNPQDRNAIRVENGRLQQVGYLPRRLAAWLAPLIDAGKIQLDGYVPGPPAAPRRDCPVTLTVFLAEKGRHLVEKTEVRSGRDALHEVVRRAYQDAHGYADPAVIVDLLDSLKPLAEQDLLPETRLLLALMPGIARETQVARTFGAMASLQELLAKITIGEPIHYRNVTIFPLRWSEAKEPPYTLLATAIERGEAVVEEVDEDGDVARLRVINRADRPLLVPEGEILIGAKQNRVVNVTILVAPRSRTTVPVSCVEQRRWRYRSREFRSAYCAPPSLRSEKLRSVQRNRARGGPAASDQGAVWANVADHLDKMGVDSETASLTDGFEAAGKTLAAYRKNVRLPEGAAGLIAACHGKVVGVELFGCAETMATLWPRLGDAYFFDALQKKGSSKPATPEQARQFIEEVFNKARPRVPALGLGEELEITGEKVVGAAVLLSGQLCHLSAFTEHQGP